MVGLARGHAAHEAGRSEHVARETVRWRGWHGSIVAALMGRVILLCAAVVSIGLVLGGCGYSASQRRELKRADAVTVQYSEAHGPRACRLLTNNAVQALYGKFTAPAPIARTICLRASSQFRGEPVKITRSELLDPNTIKVNALDQDGKFSYQVNLRKGARGRWRIDLVSQARVTQF
jgi:hypothetical protein